MEEYDKLRHNNLGEAGYTSYKFDLMSEVVGMMREASKLLGVYVICLFVYLFDDVVRECQFGV